MRYVTSWKYSLGDLKTHKKGFATLRAARRKYDEHVTERNALVMIDGMNEIDNGRMMTYVRGVDEYKGALSRLAAEILQELVTCRDVDADTLKKMAADVEAREPRAKGLADAVGRVRGVLETAE